MASALDPTGDPERSMNGLARHADNDHRNRKNEHSYQFIEVRSPRRTCPFVSHEANRIRRNNAHGNVSGESHDGAHLSKVQ